MNLSPFDRWMVQQNRRYVKTEGLDAVITRLKQQGYHRVASAVLAAEFPAKLKELKGQTQETGESST